MGTLTDSRGRRYQNDRTVYTNGTRVYLVEGNEGEIYNATATTLSINWDGGDFIGKLDYKISEFILPRLHFLIKKPTVILNED